MIADSLTSLMLAYDDEPAACTLTATREDMEEIGATKWASPPPGMTTNSIIFHTLGLWLAVLLLLLGTRF